MKPQIIIPVSLLVLTSMLFSGTAIAAGSSAKKVKTEKNSVQLKYEATTGKVEQPAHPPKSNKPAKPRHNRDHHEKDSVPPKEAARRSHGDEDGKHHHFHLHRAKKAKCFPALVCLLAKILLVIVHICLLLYVINAPFAH